MAGWIEDFEINLKTEDWSTTLSESSLRNLIEKGNDKLLKYLARSACFHEAGHAVIATVCRWPIDCIKLRLRKLSHSDVMYFSGGVKISKDGSHEVVWNDFRNSNDQKSYILYHLTQLFSLDWGGMVAEYEYLNRVNTKQVTSKDIPFWDLEKLRQHLHRVVSMFQEYHKFLPASYFWWFHDLATIELRLADLEKKFGIENPEKLAKKALETTRKIICDNRIPSSQLADLLYRNLWSSDDMSITISGQQIMEILDGKR
jgi:hypothetical protein